MADSSASAPCVYTLQAVKFIERYLTRRLVAWNGTEKQWFSELSQFTISGEVAAVKVSSIESCEMFGR